MNQHISSCPGWRSGRQVSLRKQCEEILARRKIARASQWAEIAARVENEKTRGALCDAASTHTRSRSNAEWLGDFDTELNAILARGKEASAWVRERLLFEDMDRASWFSAAGVSSLEASGRVQRLLERHAEMHQAEACNNKVLYLPGAIWKYYFEAAPKPCINGMNDAATPTAGEATRSRTSWGSVRLSGVTIVLRYAAAFLLVRRWVALHRCGRSRASRYSRLPRDVAALGRMEFSGVFAYAVGGARAVEDTTVLNVLQCMKVNDEMFDLCAALFDSALAGAHSAQEAEWKAYVMARTCSRAAAGLQAFHASWDSLQHGLDLLLSEARREGVEPRQLFSQSFVQIAGCAMNAVAKTVGEKLQSSLVCLAAVAVAPVPGSSEMWLATTTMMLGSRQHVVYEHPRDAETDTILDQFQCRSSKATRTMGVASALARLAAGSAGISRQLSCSALAMVRFGTRLPIPEDTRSVEHRNGTRKKRFFQVAPEPKDKRARPENVSSTEQDVNMQQADLLMSVWVDSDDQLSLEDFWFATEVMGATLSVDRVLKAVKHLPHVLAAAALRCSTDLTAHLEKGEGVEAAALPTDQSKEEKFARNQAFLVLHGRLQAILDGAMQGLRPAPSLEWLSTVAHFYGSLRPGPPLPRHVLEDCADLALKGDEAKELGALSLVAKGCALSGALGRHPIYGRVAHDAALALEAGTPPPARTVHDIALALSLLGPWDAQIDKAVQRFRQALVPLDRSVQSTQVDSCGASSMAGQRNGENKENQDTFYISVDASVASVAVVDGHGRRGAILSAAGRDALADLLRRMKSCSAEELAQGILLVDAELLIHEKAEPELSGATCAVMRIEGISQPKRRLLLAHLGDCGAVLGRCSKGTNGSSGTPSWSTRRLTEDHRPGERLEAARLIAAGGRVQKMPPPPQAQVDPANMGPPRLWHRQQGNAPGLAMSRGLGDALGKACGLSPEATTLEMELNE
ncbi:Probable protein phosphatase 2C 35 (AtPP2C35), partial [Durusdinium trenchii]